MKSCEMPLSKAIQIARAAVAADLTLIYYAKGTHPEKKSQCWEFKRDGRLVAQFTSPDRALEWVKSQQPNQT